jgi:hypothetical protein
MLWKRIDNLVSTDSLRGHSALAGLKQKRTLPVRPQRANLGGGCFVGRSRKRLEVLERVNPLRPGCMQRTDRQREEESVRLMAAPSEEAANTLRKDSPLIEIISTRNVRSQLAQNR